MIEVSMYNTDLPAREELPSSCELIRSTLIAAVVAVALLVTTILPAEYGIDPSGIGRLLGLTKMGEIKSSLAKEASQSDETTAMPGSKAQAEVIESSVKSPSTEVPTSLSSNKSEPSVVASGLSHQRRFTLKPGSATEIKLRMKKGASVSFEWSTKGGDVNFDTHGDSSEIGYYGYGKGRQVAGDNGELVAAFDGNHGWFWRNRSENDVTITLRTKGNYLSIDRKI